MVSKIVKHKISRRKRYRQNLVEERREAKLRARAKKESMSAEQTLVHQERHRAAQARYREKRRKELAFKAREYRRKKSDERARERDAELLAEFELMIEEGDEDPTFEEAAQRLREKTGKRYKV